MNEELKQQWEKFLAGHWQKEMPQREGIYPIHNRGIKLSKLGDYQSTDTVYLNPPTKEFVSVHRTKGLWWSEPIPFLPNPPEELL